jgi:hypothetical protein
MAISVRASKCRSAAHRLGGSRSSSSLSARMGRTVIKMIKIWGLDGQSRWDRDLTIRRRWGRLLGRRGGGSPAPAATAAAAATWTIAHGWCIPAGRTRRRGTKSRVDPEWGSKAASHTRGKMRKTKLGREQDPVACQDYLWDVSAKCPPRRVFRSRGTSYLLFCQYQIL